MPTNHGTSIPHAPATDKGRRSLMQLGERKNASLAVADRLLDLCKAGQGYRYIYAKRAERMRSCGTWMEAARMQDGKFVVIRANWCRDRLCPMCAWRRSRRNAIALQRAVDYRKQLRPGGRWILLTLTIRNVDSSDIANSLDILVHAWDNLRHRREWERCFIGGARSIEITRNSDSGTYHPHLHALLECCDDYYGDEYLTHARLLYYWRDAVSVYTGVYDQDLRVDIRAVDTGSDASGSVKEVSKYILKSAPLLESPLEDLDELAAAVHGRRLVAYTGTIRKAMRELAISDEGDQMDDMAEGREIAVDRVILRWAEAGSAYYVERQLPPDADIDAPEDGPSPKIYADLD